LQAIHARIACKQAPTAQPIRSGPLRGIGPLRMNNTLIQPTLKNGGRGLTISVIIPTYKRANLILETLGSVFAQSYKPSEIIVVNDGSPDCTEEVLTPLVSAERITYVRQENQGLAAARNKGISLATGDYIALLDDDDLWPPDTLESQIKFMKKHPETVLCYGDVFWFKDSAALPEGLDASKCSLSLLHPPVGMVEKRFLRRNWITSPGQTLIKRGVLENIGGFDRNFRTCEDYELYIRLAKQGPFAFTGRVCLFYRRQGGSLSSDVELMYRNYNLVREKHLGGMMILRYPVLWIISYLGFHRYTFRRFLTEARVQIDCGNFSQGRRLLVRAIQIFPLGLLQPSYYKLGLRSLSRATAPQPE